LSISSGTPLLRHARSTVDRLPFEQTRRRKQRTTMRRKTHSSWLGLLADGSFRPLWPQRATITNMLQPLRGRSTQPLPNRGFTHVHHNYPAPCNREYPYRKKEISAQACSKATRADMRAALRVPLWEICRSAVDASPFHGEAASLFSSSRFSEVNLTDQLADFLVQLPQLVDRHGSEIQLFAQPLLSGLCNSKLFNCHRGAFQQMC
jgi:hypothetical protein